MSSPPDNFNANASLLPDPGRDTVPIHVMRGGGAAENNEQPKKQSGNKYTEEQLKILNQYGLQKDGPIYEDIDDITKQDFLKQVDKCKIGTGDSIILHKDCSAVLAVVRALIKAGIKKQNSIDLEIEIETNSNNESNSESKFGSDNLTSSESAPEPAPKTDSKTDTNKVLSSTLIDSTTKTSESEELPNKEKKESVLKKLFTRKKRPLSSTPPKVTEENSIQWKNNPIGSIKRLGRSRKNNKNTKKNKKNEETIKKSYFRRSKTNKK
jgi:hypothetical protein